MGYAIAYWFGFWFAVGFVKKADGSWLAKALFVLLWPVHLPAIFGGILARNFK